MSRLNEIHAYLTSIGWKKEDLEEADYYSVYLSQEIMEYAHRNQKRVNGENYEEHPFRVMDAYRHLIGITPNEYDYINKDLLDEEGIPFNGVQEVCLLHDVLEDTDFSVLELEEIFKECGFNDYFKNFIKEPLIRVTHIKSMPYPDYINICNGHYVSAMVKLMDLVDNMNILGLDTLNEDNYLRTQNYLKYAYEINNKFHFIEKINEYKKRYNESKN